MESFCLTHHLFSRSLFLLNPYIHQNTCTKEKVIVSTFTRVCPCLHLWPSSLSRRFTCSFLLLFYTALVPPSVDRRPLPPVTAQTQLTRRESAVTTQSCAAWQIPLKAPAGPECVSVWSCPVCVLVHLHILQALLCVCFIFSVNYPLCYFNANYYLDQEEN